MEQGQLALAIGLEQLSRKQETLTNNLANLNSTGFKRQTGSFREKLTAAGDSLATVPEYFEQTDYSQGDLQQTDDPLSLGLQGKGFLSVRKPGDPDSVFFTRDGTMAISKSGMLVTRSGFEILDRSARPINTGGAVDLKISTQGEVINRETQEKIGRIARWSFPNRAGLRSLGLGLHRPTAEAGEAEEDNTTLVHQSMLERSNVDSVRELVSMITLQRQYQAAQRALQVMESVNQGLTSLASS